MEQIVVGIDVGSTKVCTLVGAFLDNKTLRVLGVGNVPSAGIRRGVVVDVASASECITASVERAEHSSGIPIDAAHVSIGGTHLSSLNSRGIVAVAHPDRGITQEDVQRALHQAHSVAFPHNQIVLHSEPRGFVVDGEPGVHAPVGMRGYRLEVEAHIVTGAEGSVQNLSQCVENAGVAVLGLVPKPLASAEALLTQSERDMGVVVADIGGGTADVAIYIEGSVWHTAVLPLGGMSITNDIAVGIKAPFATAEEIKLQHGHAVPEDVGVNETVDMVVFGETGRQLVPRQFLAEIIGARTEEILNLVVREVKRSGYDSLLPAGLVVCGGTALLPGLPKLSRRILNMPVRTAMPRDIQGLVDDIQTPAFATSVGLLRWALAHAPQVALASKPREGSRGKFWDFLKALLPG